AQSATTSRAAAAGTATTARSTGAPIAATDGYARSPAISSARGFTGYTTPGKPPARGARSTPAPMPTAAPPPGANSGGSGRSSPERPRANPAASAASSGNVGTRTWYTSESR